MAQIVFNIAVPINIEKKNDNLYIAACRPLDVFTQGATVEQAKHNIQEALDVFLSTCVEMGTLEEVLHGCGFKPGTIPTNHLQPAFSGDFVNVPLPFICADSNNKNKCHHA